MNRFVDVLLAKPKLVLTLFLIALVFIGYHIRYFQIDASADTLLTKNNKLYIQTQQMSERFAPQEFLLIGYKPKQHELFSEQTFNDLRQLSTELKKLERVESVRSILNVPLLLLMEGDITGADPSAWTIENKQFSTEQLQRTFAGHPIYEQLVVSEDGDATALQVLFKPNEKLEEIQARVNDIQRHALTRELTSEEERKIADLEEQAEPMEQALGELRSEEIAQIRSAIAAYEDRAELYLGGAHVVGQQLIDIIKSDLAIFGAVILGMICLTLLLLFRSLRWILIPLICCGVSVALTMGLFGLFGLKTTVISSNFIALQLILTLAIVIHLIVQYREYARAEPAWTQDQIVHATLRRKIAPCFYAGLTTSVGFASLLITGIQPVVAFGWMMIIAVSVSIITSLFLFPALMELFPKEAVRERKSLVQLLLKAFNFLVVKYPRWVVVASLAALGICAAGLLQLNVENSFINYFSDNTQVHRELVFIDQELGGSTPLDITITIPKEERGDAELVLSAANVQKMQLVQSMLEEQLGMGKVLSVVNVTELAKQINDGKPITEYELTALYRMIDEELRRDLVGSFYSEEHNQLRISARIKDTTEGLNRAELLERIHAGMSDIGIERENYHLTNLFVLYQDILERLYRSQILALGIVYLVLTFTFMVVFRSLRVAVVSIAPNILSTISVLGIMGWLGLPLDLMTITIASIAMGIAVDDTIHYVHRYREEISKSNDDSAIKRTNFSVGYAVVYTSLVVILGFGALAFSNFVPSVHFGLLTGLAMAMALLWNLSLLPVLLRKFVRA